MDKPIDATWTFRSSSSATTRYETRLYSDGTTSCNCPGWTRQVHDGERYCKHTRAVDNGSADRLCESKRGIRRFNEPTARVQATTESMMIRVKAQPSNPLATPENVARAKAEQRQPLPTDEKGNRNRERILAILDAEVKKSQSTPTPIPAPQKPGTIKRKIDLDLLEEGE